MIDRTQRQHNTAVYMLPEDSKRKNTEVGKKPLLYLPVYFLPVALLGTLLFTSVSLPILLLPIGMTASTSVVSAVNKIWKEFLFVLGVNIRI
jgi:hypothetical protein